MSFPVPADEPARLAALRFLAILDTEREPLYDDVVQLAAAICLAPVAVMNLVDGDRQWGKAMVGLADSEAPREDSFCARTIVAPEGWFVVPDTLADPAWADNPMVTGGPRLRFYAGAAVHDEDGYAVGTVCVADRVPRELTCVQVAALRTLARQAEANLALRRRTLQLQAANRALEHRALHDALTGLPNRALLEDRLEHELARARRSGGRLAVLFGDLDRFKAVNDGLGHEAGDEVLRTVAQRLRRAARSTDTVARIAGDEFVVICPDVTGSEEAEVVASRLREAVGHPIALADGPVTVQISIGVALAHGDPDRDLLLQEADRSMYAVKRADALAR